MLIKNVKTCFTFFVCFFLNYTVQSFRAALFVTLWSFAFFFYSEMTNWFLTFGCVTNPCFQNLKKNTKKKIQKKETCNPIHKNSVTPRPDLSLSYKSLKITVWQDPFFFNLVFFMQIFDTMFKLEFRENYRVYLWPCFKFRLVLV